MVGDRLMVMRAAIAIVGALVMASCGTPPATDSAPVGTPTVPAFEADVLLASAVVVEGLTCGRQSVGSGVVIADGILTNAHVVAGIDDLTVRGPDGTTVSAVVVAIDPRTDLALLRADDLEAPALAVGTPTGASAAVALVGGGGELEALDVVIERTITINISDIYGDGEYRRKGIELTADIAAGDSGGAIVNAAGEVVGLVFSTSSRNEDVSYAISSVEFAALVEAADAADGAPVDVGACRR